MKNTIGVLLLSGATFPLKLIPNAKTVIEKKRNSKTLPSHVAGGSVELEL